MPAPTLTARPPASRPPLLAVLPATITPDGTIAGYASLFDIPDQGGDIVARGAFTDTLARHGTSGIRMLFQHDPREPIGIWTSIVEDARGLRVEGKLTLQASRARDLDALIRDGALDGLSIGFKTVSSQRLPRSGLRRLTRIDLWEISIVTFPMLSAARITRKFSSSYPRAPNPGDTATVHWAMPPPRTPLQELAATIRNSTSQSKPR